MQVLLRLWMALPVIVGPLRFLESMVFAALLDFRSLPASLSLSDLISQPQQRMRQPRTS